MKKCDIKQAWQGGERVTIRWSGVTWPGYVIGAAPNDRWRVTDDHGGIPLVRDIVSTWAKRVEREHLERERDAESWRVKIDNHEVQANLVHDLESLGLVGAKPHRVPMMRPWQGDDPCVILTYDDVRRPVGDL